MGTRSVIRSLVTLATEETRRSAFWQGELVAALRIVEAGDIAVEAMVGSWAGAMGHTQFIPSTYLAHAIDFDGDGRRDIWRSIPDALGSTANYLKASGWKRDERWGEEVILPAGFDPARSGPGEPRRAWAEWQALGLVPTAVVPRGGQPLQLILPAGIKGPAFLVGSNFRAILAYNTATSYALAVAQLADRLAGRGPLLASWPEGDKGLVRADREELQRRLTARGLDTGGIDGVLGAQTRNAIRRYQREASLPEDGHPSQELLERLRRDGVP
jgi:membrane-bound lytic murein transglycosylase B